MTWGDLKKKAEELGVGDEAEVRVYDNDYYESFPLDVEQVEFHGEMLVIG